MFNCRGVPGIAITKSCYSCFGSTTINIPDPIPFPSLLDHKYILISQGLGTIWGPQFARIQVKQFSIMCNGPLLWNKLPESVKNLKSIGSFKKSIKLLLM